MNNKKKQTSLTDLIVYLAGICFSGCEVVLIGEDEGDFLLIRRSRDNENLVITPPLS